jgi:hypothetical protein
MVLVSRTSDQGKALLFRHARSLAAICGLLAAGCASHRPSNLTVPRSTDAIDLALRPLLSLDPDANWTPIYNQLIPSAELAADRIAGSVADRTYAPDDLALILRLSLWHLLAADAAAPRLSVHAYETTLDLLHFDLKVHGKPLGTPLQPPGAIPARWHDLYPGEIDQSLAERIDAEADRKAMLSWWRGSRGSTRARVLTPDPQRLLEVLGRRRADEWSYEAVRRSAVVWFEQNPDCKGGAFQPAADVASRFGPPLLRLETADYNLVRAACVWLGCSSDPAILDALIERVGHASLIVSHNARLALKWSREPRIRELLERYNSRRPPAAESPLDSRRL